MKFERYEKRMRAVGTAFWCGLVAVALGIGAVTPASLCASSASQIDRSVTQALNTLYKNNSGAKALGDKAVAVLVFPNIVKGDGALRKNGKTSAYYRSLAASYGFQAGAQAFGYVLFFMDDASVRYLDNSDGWEVGTGPSLVVLDAGFGKNLSTTTLQKGVYAYIFDQKGLMGGVGIQGSKITKIHPNP
jgi:lipid-binding SYLF domain-containing protein